MKELGQVGPMGVATLQRGKITYGTFVAGKGTNYVLDARRRPMRYAKRKGVFEFSCEIVVAETTESAFRTACTNLENAFSEVNAGKLFKLEFDSDIHETYDPAANTGFNARPSWEKPGSPTDTALSRRYVVRVELDLPANQTGRRDVSWEVRYTDSRKMQLVVEGVYTAISSSYALEAYRAGIDAYVATIQGVLGGVWEGPSDEQLRGDDEHGVGSGSSGSNKIGKVLRFRVVYDELIYPKVLGALTDDARLRRQVLKVSQDSPAPGDWWPKKGVFRLRRLQLVYSAAVVKTATQDLVALYESAVKPFLIEELKKAANGRAIALTSHRPELDRAENRIAVTMEAFAAAGQFLESRIVTQDEIDAGNETVGVWDDRKFSKHVFDNPGGFFRTVVHEYEVLGGPEKAAAAAAGGGAVGAIGVNRPVAFEIVESSDAEAAIDAFFGVSVGADGGAGGGGDDGFASAGGVPEPAGLKRVFLYGLLSVEPVTRGEPGEPQLSSTRVRKLKRYEYVLEPESGGASTTGPTDPVRQVSPGGGAR